MFAIKPRIEVVIRVVLTAAFLFSAVGPTTVFAQAEVTNENLSLPGTKGSAFNFSAHLSRRNGFQIATSTPTNTEAPTPEPSLIPTIEITPTATATPSRSPTSTLETTSTATVIHPLQEHRHRLHYPSNF